MRAATSSAPGSPSAPTSVRLLELERHGGRGGGAGLPAEVLGGVVVRPTKNLNELPNQNFGSRSESVRRVHQSLPLGVGVGRSKLDDEGDNRGRNRLAVAGGEDGEDLLLDALDGRLHKPAVTNSEVTAMLTLDLLNEGASAASARLCFAAERVTGDVLTTGSGLALRS